MINHHSHYVYRIHRDRIIILDKFSSLKCYKYGILNLSDRWQMLFFWALLMFVYWTNWQQLSTVNCPEFNLELWKHINPEVQKCWISHKNFWVKTQDSKLPNYYLPKMTFYDSMTFNDYYYYDSLWLLTNYFDFDYLTIWLFDYNF